VQAFDEGRTARQQPRYLNTNPRHNAHVDRHIRAVSDLNADF
jgi:hypothetical protein